MKTLFSLGILLFCSFIYGQTKSFDIADFLAKHFPENYNERSIDLLENLIENKIDLNKLSFTDKSKLFFIKENLIDKIIKYREKYGRFSSIDDLYGITDINPNELNLLIPFVKVTIQQNARQRKFPNILPGIKFRSRIIRKSTSSNSYYSRIIGLNKYYQFSGVYDNSPDFNNIRLKNYSLKISPSEFLSTIIAGRYNINFGFGLSLWGPYKMFKGIYYRSVRRSNSRLKMYKSASSNSVLNGLGINLRSGNFNIKTFYSENIDDDISTHFGTILQYFSEKVQIDFLYHKIIPENVVAKNSESVSVSASVGFSDWKYENEINFSNNNLSQLHTLKYFPSDDVTLFYLVRNYSDLDNQFFANPLRESSGKTNEFGQIFCLEFSFTQRKLLLFLDKYQKSAKLNPNVNLNGTEFSLRFIDKSLTAFENIFDLKYEKKEEFDNSETNYFIGSDKSLKMKIKTICKISNKANFYARIDYIKNLAPDINPGYAITSGLNLQIPEKVQVKSRFTSYSVKTNSSAIYIYDDDLPGMFLTKQFSGNGIYWYFLARFRIIADLWCSFKYSEQTTGNNDFNSNFSESKRELKLQIDLKI